MSTRNLTKTTIGLILLSLLAIAVPAQATGCSYSVDYVAGDTYGFHCPGAHSATISVTDLMGQPAIEVCDASGTCFTGCGNAAIDSGEFVSVYVQVVYIDPGTGGICLGSIGQMNVEFS